MRRVVLSGVAAVIVSLSCGPDLTGPRAGRLSNGIGFITEFPSQVAGGSDLVPFNRVRIVLARSDETTALDTIVNYPATGELSLSLRVRLSPDAPSTGEQLLMSLEYLNAAGDVVFTGGPTLVTAVPAGNVATEPVSIPVVYVGPGSNAAQVVIAEGPQSVPIGGAFMFTAVALDGQGQPIAGTPIGWRSLDPTIATISAISAGAGTAQQVSGTARIVAQLLTGPADTVTVDVIAGPTHLAFVQQPTNVTAGIPIGPAITVVAKDAQGVNVPSFVGNVTISIGTNPGLSGIGGTLTTAAVGGVATFNDVRLNRAANGYTLVASSGALTNATSAAFNVVPAPAIAAVIDSGNAQSASPSALLPQKLVVKVIDSLGNGIAGEPITWDVTGGTGILTNSTNTTDANGRARTNWTLGPEQGTQSVQAYAEAIDDVVDFTATALPPGVTKVWTGATSNAWATATNWSPAGVPIATDGVQIPAVVNQPAMSGSVTIASLFTETGSQLDLSTTTLTVNGSVNASGPIVGTGSLILNGTGTFQGFVVGGNQTFVQGNYTLNGNTGTGRLEVKGSLAFGGQVLSVTGPFLTADNGTISMNNTDDVLAVSGNAFFGGGNQAGLLNFGTIQVMGNFSQTAGTSANSYVASFNHTTVLAGAGDQTISFATPDTVTLAAACAGSCFGALTIAKSTGNTTFNTAASVRGDLDVLSSSGTVTAIGADGSPKVITVARVTDILPGGVVHFTRFRTAGDIFLDPTTIIDTIGFSGNSGQVIPGGTYGTVQILGQPTLSGDLATTGNLVVADGAVAAALLQLTGQRVDVGGNFIVTNGGTVDMSQLSDSIVVAGNAFFGGAEVAGFLTVGTLIVGGDFTQTGGATFAPSGSHKTVLNGTGLQTIGFANPGQSFFRRLFIEKTAGGVQFVTNAQVNGVLRASTSVTAAAPFRVVADTLWGALGSGFTPFVFELRSPVLADSGVFEADTVVFSGNQLTTLQTSTDGAGTYTYNSVRVATAGVNVAVGVPVLNIQNDLVVSSGTFVPNGSRVAVLGNFRTETGGLFQMTASLDSIGVAGNVSMGGGSTTSILNNGVLTIGGNFVQLGSSTSFAPSLNHRTKFIGSAPGVHTISFASPATSFFRDLILDKPAGTGQVITLLSNVLVTDSMTVQNGTTLNSAATQRLTVQGRFVYVGAGQPTVNPFVLELTTLAPALDSTQINLPRFIPDTLVLSGAANYFLPFSNYTRLKHVRVSVGPTNIVDMFGTGANDTLAGEMQVTSGKLRLTSGSYIVQKLRTTNTGHMEMSAGAPLLVVRDSTIFGGGTPNPLLNSGTIRAQGHFVQTSGTSAASFNADPPHTVEFAGPSNQNIFFQSPGFTAALSHFGNLRITNPSGVTLQSDVLTHQLLDQSPGTQEKISSAGFLLTAEGVDVNDMLFDNTRFALVNNFPVTRFDTVTFANYTGTPDILTVTRSATIPAFFGLTFPSAGFTGRYVNLNTPINVNLSLNQVLPAAPPQSNFFVCTGTGGLLIWNATRLSGSGC